MFPAAVISGSKLRTDVHSRRADVEAHERLTQPADKSRNFRLPTVSYTCSLLLVSIASTSTPIPTIPTEVYPSYHYLDTLSDTGQSSSWCRCSRSAVSRPKLPHLHLRSLE